MKINEIENLYVVKVCTKKSSAQYAHIYENIPDITQLFPKSRLFSLKDGLGQFTRNYTQTVKRAADNKRRYAPGWVHSTCLLRGFP
ncbi:MAG: hypothetical protein SPG48_12645, partial [Treponema sp.]|nr:hypothetical protein [Treponema sp.]